MYGARQVACPPKLIIFFQGDTTGVKYKFFRKLEAGPLFLVQFHPNPKYFFRSYPCSVMLRNNLSTPTPTQMKKCHHHQYPLSTLPAPSSGSHNHHRHQVLVQDRIVQRQHREVELLFSLILSSQYPSCHHYPPSSSSPIAQLLGGILRRRNLSNSLVSSPIAQFLGGICRRRRNPIVSTEVKKEVALKKHQVEEMDSERNLEQDCFKNCISP